jgi:signal transduction histidine kinase
VRLDRDSAVTGSGLGLSLVAAIVRLHRGTLSLGDNSPGLRVDCEFPRA